jgi:ABC-type phosphate transport system substrate-binding protein
MKKHNNLDSMLPALAAFIFFCAWSPLAQAGDAIVIIVNAANPVENLTVGELKKLFLSDRSKWDTGKSVFPVMVTAGAPERTSFLRIVCGQNDADFSKYFLQAAFTGKSATPPKEVGSAAAVKSVVGNSPGAIGFVRAGDLSGSETTVKVVKVDGASATDSGYKLKM